MSDSLDDLDDFMAELDRDLKKPGSATTKANKPKVTYSGPAVAVTWKPSHIALHVLTQRCQCGCEAQSVTGLFAQYSNPNGFLRAVRVTKSTIPEEFKGKLWRIEETSEILEVCPGCIDDHNAQGVTP